MVFVIGTAVINTHTHPSPALANSPLTPPGCFNSHWHLAKQKLLQGSHERGSGNLVRLHFGRVRIDVDCSCLVVEHPVNTPVTSMMPVLLLLAFMRTTLGMHSVANLCWTSSVRTAKFQRMTRCPALSPFCSREWVGLVLAPYFRLRGKSYSRRLVSVNEYLLFLGDHWISCLSQVFL